MSEEKRALTEEVCNVLEMLTQHKMEVATMLDEVAESFVAVKNSM